MKPEEFNPQKGKNETPEQYQARIDAWLATLDTDMDGSVTLPLRWPRTFTSKGAGGETSEELNELTIRRPRGSDRRSVDVNTAPQKVMLDLLARVTGLTNKHIDELDEADIDRAELVILNFS